MDCSLPDSSIHGISRQEYWSGLSFPPLGDLLDPGITPASPASLALQADFYLLSHQEALYINYTSSFKEGLICGRLAWALFLPEAPTVPQHQDGQGKKAEQGDIYILGM